MLIAVYRQRRAKNTPKIQMPLDYPPSLQPNANLIRLLTIDLRLPSLGLIVVLVLLALLPLAVLPQRLGHLLVFLLLHLVPLDVVLVRNGLNLLTQRVAVFDQDLPLPEVELVLLVELLLAARDGEVHGAAVGDLAVVVQEPDVTTYQGRETDEVLYGVSKIRERLGSNVRSRAP
jgi:hypothetical protein